MAVSVMMIILILMTMVRVVVMMMTMTMTMTMTITILLQCWLSLSWQPPTMIVVVTLKVIVDGWMDVWCGNGWENYDNDIQNSLTV